MIKYELKPTDKNIRETLLNDSLGRNTGIASFIELLNTIDDNSVIAIDDAWGNGKTFFVKQIQLTLKSYCSSTEEADSIKKCVPVKMKGDNPIYFIPIYYDAWVNDNDNDPILSIVNWMLRDLVALKDFEVSNHDWIKTLIVSVDLIIKAVSGVQIKDFLTTLRSDDPLSEIKKQKKLDELLSELFDELLKSCKNDTRIVFFVDELDRCRPDFAVKVLERIKHYFYHEKVIFVISTNIKELQHTIRRYYGDGFDACKYLTRFFDITITLLLPNYQRYYEMLKFTNHSHIRANITCFMIKYYNFSLRDITRFLQSLRIAVPEKYRGWDYDDVSIFYMEILVPFLLGLKIHNVNQYEDFIRGDNAAPFVELMQAGDVDRYCGVFLDKNETFDNDSNGKTFVSLKSRFDLFYKAFFGLDSRGADDPVEIRIGKNRFLSYDKKRWIMDAMSLFYSSNNY